MLTQSFGRNYPFLIRERGGNEGRKAPRRSEAHEVPEATKEQAHEVPEATKEQAHEGPEGHESWRTKVLTRKRRK